MAKAKATAFFCGECGFESAKWMGQCPACKAWNAFVEEPTAKKEGPAAAAAKRAGGLLRGRTLKIIFYMFPTATKAPFIPARAG